MNVLQRIARLVAPPTCNGCGVEGWVLCWDCLGRLASGPHPACFGCRKYNKTGVTCQPCSRLTAVAGLTAAGTYDCGRRELVRQLKYRRLREAAAPLAFELAALVVAWDFDVVTAVPAATSRHRQRGYNQAELIARELATRLGLPYRQLLRRVSNSRQVGHSRAQRLRQAPRTFALLSWPARRVLLVDDVLTTGATVDACARRLAEASACTWVAVAAIRE